MSFSDQMTAAIDEARTLTRLDHLSRAIWQGLAAGALADDDAQALAERLHARRSLIRGEIKPVGLPPGRPSIFPPKRLQRAPKRPVAIARRRHLAASGPMPPALACKFTVSELAVLRIVGDEVRQHGQCDRCVDEIAARAGVCRSLVKNAIRTAARLGLLTVEERRREGRRNQVRPFLAAQPPCTVAMEACGSAHYWAREIGMLGHAVRLIPPAYVKLFVKRQKNNATDAEAICEAAQRPTMRFVAPKSEQAQAAALVFRARDLLVRQR